MFYQNAYPITAVAYGLYPIRGPDPANIAPLRDGDLSCVAQRVVDGKSKSGRMGYMEMVQPLTTWQSWKGSLSWRSFLMANVGCVEQIWSSLSTAAMLGQKTSTFPGPGNSTSTRATSGRRSVVSPTVRRWRYGCWVGTKTRTSAGSLSTTSCCRTAAPIERKRSRKTLSDLRQIRHPRA